MCTAQATQCSSAPLVPTTANFNSNNQILIATSIDTIVGNFNNMETGTTAATYKGLLYGNSAIYVDSGATAATAANNAGVSGVVGSVGVGRWR